MAVSELFEWTHRYSPNLPVVESLVKLKKIHQTAREFFKQSKHEKKMIAVDKKISDRIDGLILDQNINALVFDAQEYLDAQIILSTCILTKLPHWNFYGEYFEAQTGCGPRTLQSIKEFIELDIDCPELNYTELDYTSNDEPEPIGYVKHLTPNRYTETIEVRETRLRASQKRARHWRKFYKELWAESKEYWKRLRTEQTSYYVEYDFKSSVVDVDLENFGKKRVEIGWFGLDDCPSFDVLKEEVLDFEGGLVIIDEFDW